MRQNQVFNWYMLQRVIFPKKKCSYREILNNMHQGTLQGAWWQSCCESLVKFPWEMSEELCTEEIALASHCQSTLRHTPIFLQENLAKNNSPGEHQIREYCDTVNYPSNLMEKLEPDQKYKFITLRHIQAHRPCILRTIAIPVGMGLKDFDKLATICSEGMSGAVKKGHRYYL